METFWRAGRGVEWQVDEGPLFSNFPKFLFFAALCSFSAERVSVKFWSAGTAWDEKERNPSCPFIYQALVGEEFVAPLVGKEIRPKISN